MGGLELCESSESVFVAMGWVCLQVFYTYILAQLCFNGFVQVIISGLKLIRGIIIKNKLIGTWLNFICY